MESQRLKTAARKNIDRVQVGWCLIFHKHYVHTRDSCQDFLLIPHSLEGKEKSRFFLIPFEKFLDTQEPFTLLCYFLFQSSPVVLVILCILTLCFPSLASILISCVRLSSLFSSLPSPLLSFSCFVIFKTRESQGAFNLNFARLSFPSSFLPSSLLSLTDFGGTFLASPLMILASLLISLLMILGCFLAPSLFLILSPQFFARLIVHKAFTLFPSLFFMHVTYVLRFLVKDFHCITCSRDVLCFTCLSGFVFWTKKKEWRMALETLRLCCISIPFAFLSLSLLLIPKQNKRKHTGSHLMIYISLLFWGVFW